jgi:hypothetical protein
MSKRKKKNYMQRNKDENNSNKPGQPEEHGKTLLK